MAEWRDTTSYPQSDTERVPQTWEALPGGVRLSVTRYVGMDGWFIRCSTFDIDLDELLAEDIGAAKYEALHIFTEAAAFAEARASRARHEALKLISA